MACRCGHRMDRPRFNLMCNSRHHSSYKQLHLIKCKDARLDCIEFQPTGVFSVNYQLHVYSQNVKPALMLPVL